jgi:translation initiation factor 2 beta subunit (eIF-2beta)/eIF-5
MIRTVVLNVNDIADALGATGSRESIAASQFVCTPDNILRFFSLALGTDADLSTRSIGGNRSISTLQALLRQYIDDFVCCPACHLPEMQRQFENSGNLSGRCEACGWQGRLSHTRSYSQRLNEQMFKRIQLSKNDVQQEMDSTDLASSPCEARGMVEAAEAAELVGTQLPTEAVAERALKVNDRQRLRHQARRECAHPRKGGAHMSCAGRHQAKVQSGGAQDDPAVPHVRATPSKAARRV